MKDIEKNKRAGSAIRKWRKSAGLSQKQLAEIVGVRQNTISSYESGRNAVPQYIARAIAEALDVPLSEITEADDAEQKRVLKITFDQSSVGKASAIVTRSLLGDEQFVLSAELVNAAFGVTPRELNAVRAFLESSGYTIMLNCRRFDDIDADVDDITAFDYIESEDIEDESGNVRTIRNGYKVSPVLLHDGKRYSISPATLRSLIDYLRTCTEFYLFHFKQMELTEMKEGDAT